MVVDQEISTHHLKAVMMKGANMALIDIPGWMNSPNLTEWTAIPQGTAILLKEKDLGLTDLVHVTTPMVEVATSRIAKEEVIRVETTTRDISAAQALIAAPPRRDARSSAGRHHRHLFAAAEVIGALARGATGA